MTRLTRIVPAICVAVVAVCSSVSGVGTVPSSRGEVVAEAAQSSSPEAPPREWIEPATGHRVIRLSDAPGSASLYFHQNQYTATGDKMIFSTKEGLSTINLKTRKIDALVEGRAGKVIVGRKTRQVFYMIEDTVYATDLDSKRTRTIAKTPELRGASGFAVNADESLLAGSYTEGDVGRPPATPPAEANLIPASQESNLEARWLARRPMRLFTIGIKSGEVRTFHPSTDWLNDVQFSPTDPTLLMFCHEGPWHKVDRI